MDKSNGRIIALSLISLAVLSGCGGSDVSQKKLDKIGKDAIDKTIAEIKNIELSEIDKQGYLYEHDFTEQALQLGYSKQELDSLCSNENIPENAMVSCQVLDIGDESHPMIMMQDFPGFGRTVTSTNDYDTMVTIDLADRLQSLTFTQVLHYDFSNKGYDLSSIVSKSLPQTTFLQIEFQGHNNMVWDSFNERVDKDSPQSKIDQTLTVTFNNMAGSSAMGNIATNASGFTLAKTPLQIKTETGATETYPTVSEENYDLSLLPYAMKRYQTVLDHWRQ